jgi:ATP-binding cassette subfamily B protein
MRFYGKVLMRVLTFIFETAKPYRLYLWGIFIAMCLITLDNTLKPVLVKQLVDIVAGKLEANLWIRCALYGVLQIILVSAWTMSDYCFVRYTAKFRLSVAEYFMKRLYDYPYHFFQNQLTGSLTSKMNDAFQNLPHLIFIILNHFGYCLLLIIISLVLLASVAPIFSVIMMIWVGLFFVILSLSMKKMLILDKKYAEEKSKIIGLSADYFGNMLSVKTFATRNFELQRFSNLKNHFIEFSEHSGLYRTWFYAYLGGFTSIYAIGFILFLVLGYQKGQISPGDFSLVIMLNFNVISTIFTLSNTLREFITSWGAVDQAIALFEKPPDITDKSEASPIKIHKGEIAFESVTFQHQDTEPLFKNKSVTIEAGQKVGLVGYSGGGKSTFVNLILRLFDVTDGTIFIDGQDIRDVTQDSLRSNIAMIPQDPSLFHRSLMDNIRYGRTDATDEEVIEVAKKAHAHEFISKLPQEYESLVGERGIKLSGGQRQRIAIARAILKNAPILILDEATSQLDSVTEGGIQESLWALMQNKTTLVIAHRLSTLLHMDRILVFDQGKIVEDGTHAELLGKNGLYRTLWDAQVGGFLPDKAVTW